MYAHRISVSALLLSLLVSATALSEETTLKEGAKQVGQETGNVVHQIGEDSKEAGKKVADTARDVGHATRDAAKEVGKKVVDTATEVGHATRDGAKEFGKAARGEKTSTTPAPQHKAE